jgi:hypothetical protein
VFYNVYIFLHILPPCNISRSVKLNEN